MTPSIKATALGLFLLPAVAFSSFDDHHSTEAIAAALTSPIPSKVLQEAHDFDDKLISGGTHGGEKVYLITDDRSRKANAMVQNLLRAMGANSNDWVVRVLDTNPPISNAFVVGGKYIYIYTGAINDATSDDELAFVIAHELGHSLLKHVLRREGDITSTIATVALIGALLSRNHREDLSAFAKITTASYGRGDEEEADAIAVAISRRAGYDPIRGADFFSRSKRRFDEEERQHQQSLQQMRRNVQQAQANCQQLYQTYNSSSRYQTQENANRVNATCRDAESQRVQYNNTSARYDAYVQQQKLNGFFSTHPEPQNRIAAIAAVSDYVNKRRDLSTLSRYKQSQRVMVALNRLNSPLLMAPDSFLTSGSINGSSSQANPVSPFPQESSNHSLIVGNWRSVGKFTNILSEIRRDGTLVISLLDSSGAAYGTWDIRDNRFTGEIKRSSLDWFPSGSSWSDTILELSETDLVLRADGGVLEQYRRITH